MSEVNFQSQPEATAPAPDATVPAGTPPGMSVAQREAPLLGDTLPNMRDIILPRLNTAQNIGNLKDAHEPGTIVFGMTVPLWIPPKFEKGTGNCTRQASPPVEIIVLGFRPTRFVECTTGGARGRIFNTEAEVVANGGTLDFKEWQLKQMKGMKRFQPLAEAMVAVYRPEMCKPVAPRTEDDEATFVFDVDGKKAALALWAMKGSAYTAAAKRVLFPARLTGCLKIGGYPSFSFGYTTVEQQFDTGNKAWVPVLTPMHRSSPAVMAWVKDILTPGTTQDAAPESVDDEAAS